MRAWILGCKASGLGIMVGFRVCGLRFRDYGGFQGVRFKVWGLWWVSGCEV